MRYIAPRTERSIVLCGSMGAGKTTVAPIVAQRFGIPVIETDDLIRKMAGMSIPLIFAERGESRFRELEIRALLKALEYGAAVIDTGGGTLCEPAAWKALRARGALSVYLHAPVEVLAQRAEIEERPLLAGADTFEKKKEALSGLVAKRDHWYQRSDIHVDASGEAKDVAASVAQEALEAMLHSVPVRLGPQSYSCWIENGMEALGPRLAARLPPQGATKRCSLVCDENVADSFGVKAQSSLQAAGYDVSTHKVAASESGKSLHVASALIDGLLESGHQRGSPLVALGGGITGDLTGFVASIIHRGCPVAQVPTTLLAMVDSSIGGKTGVNHRLGKNLIGSFNQPVLVHVPIQALHALSDRDYRAGLAEVIKTALLDPGWRLFEAIEREVDAIIQRDVRVLVPLIARCVALKAAYCELDPTETIGHRRILNLGHTLGHALEAHDLEVRGNAGRWNHGEAVGLGLVASARVGASLGLAPSDLERRIWDLLGFFGLPNDISSVFSQEVIARVQYDKKSDGDLVRYVAPVAGGGAEIVPLSIKDLEYHLGSIRRGA